MAGQRLARQPVRPEVVSLRIRTEQKADHSAIHALNVAAFGRRDEADLVERLRRAARPFVSLVAHEGDRLVGHIAFSPVSIAGHNALLMGLAPMAVLPARQRVGIGSALVRAGLQRCREIGTTAVVVLGHPNFYPRFGFAPASRFGIASEYRAPPEAFMALELEPGALQGVFGTVKFHAAFSGM